MKSSVDFCINDRVQYAPSSLTVSLYETEKLTYGFTYNTKKRPLCPVIQIEMGNALTHSHSEYSCRVDEAHSYNENDELFTYYVVKTEISLLPDTVYSYRAYDKGADIGSDIVSFATTNPRTKAFQFAHVSDSQTDGESSEKIGRSQPYHLHRDR